MVEGIVTAMISPYAENGDFNVSAAAAASIRASPTPRRSPINACCNRSGRSATPTTNALAGSFLDSFKTELIADRIWQTRAQLELAVVEYTAWFHRLDSALGDLPPAEFEALSAPR